ncbi:PAS domain-containing protein [Parapusillimonas sp. SGNA-6]|nr:PAS domain-containing protein [Parapusillimonas sp. SGNA-6]
MQNVIAALDDETPLGLVILDKDHVIEYMNRHMLRWTSLDLEQAAGSSFLSLFPGVSDKALQRLLDSGVTSPNAVLDTVEPAGHVDIRLPTPSHPDVDLQSLVCFLCSEPQAEPRYAVLFHDASDANPFHRAFAVAMQRLHVIKLDRLRLAKRLERANNHLLRSEKLAGIGQLAAGVAHEINNPIGYVFSNLKTLASYVQDLLKITDAVDSAHSTDELRHLKRALEYSYIRGDVEALIEESEEGIDRVKKIIMALKDFSHIEEEGFRYADLHRGLETTLNVANNELKYKAEIVKEYGELPEVECNASQINQVIMNLLVNAAQAITGTGTITIRTGQSGPWVWLEVEDTGCGMAPDVVSRIFVPFFTTKPVGQGTGLGLSLSYSIVQKHHGDIEVFSEEGKGTRFRVWLPIVHAELPDLRGNGQND